MNIVLISLLSGLMVVTAPKSKICNQCQELKDKISSGEQEEMQIEKKLKQERTAMADLRSENITDKARLSSNIFILSAKIETIQNRRILYKQDLSKIDCSPCAIKSIPSPTPN